MQAFSDPYFPVYGHNRIRFIWTQSYPIIVSYRIVSDSVHTRKKTDQRKPTFRDTSRTVKKKELYKIFDANSKMVIPYK